MDSATEPESSGTSLSPSEGSKLNSVQYEFLKYCEQQYWATGRLPAILSTAEFLGLTESAQLEAWRHPLFLEALLSRGIPAHLLAKHLGAVGVGSQKNWPNSLIDTLTALPVLTDQQMTVANVLLDVHDKRSRLKKLTELGVSTNEYNLWLRDPVYRAYALSRAEDLLVQNQSVAHLSLINRVEQGDLGAIKYFNSMTGRFRETSGIGGNSGVNVTVNTGTNALLIEVVEIIQRHVTDPAVLDAIASDILALTKGEVKQREPVTSTAFRGELA